MIKLKSITVLLSFVLSTSVIAAPEGHFDPKGKAPSKHTIAVLEEARASLPFADKRDFDEQKKGFMAAPATSTIKADAGHVAWDLERFNWLMESENFDSIHPSLVRQSKLNMNNGLYEVVPGFYQVRGFDLANVTFVKGKTGWIVFDPLTAAELARAIGVRVYTIGVGTTGMAPFPVDDPVFGRRCPFINLLFDSYVFIG